MRVCASGRIVRRGHGERTRPQRHCAGGRGGEGIITSAIQRQQARSGLGQRRGLECRGGGPFCYAARRARANRHGPASSTQGISLPCRTCQGKGAPGDVVRVTGQDAAHYSSKRQPRDFRRRVAVEQVAARDIARRRISMVRCIEQVVR